MPVRPATPRCGDHGAFKLAGTAVFEDEICVEAADPFLIAVQFVRLNGRQAVP